MPTVSSYIQFLGTKTGGGTQVIQVLDAEHLADHFLSQGKSPARWHGKANSFVLPRNSATGIGWFLLPKSEYDKLDTGVATHAVRFVGPGTVTVSKLTIIDAVALTSDSTLATNTVMLVRVEDLRYLAKQATVAKNYNIRTPTNDPTNNEYAYGDNTAYYAASLNSGSAWTWATLVADLWALLPSAVGSLDTSAASFPTTSNPEGYHFWGMCAWEALQRVLTDCEHNLTLDTDGTFYVRDATAAVTTHAAKRAQILDWMLEDNQSIESDPSNYPAQVDIIYPSRNWAFENSTDPNELTSSDYWLQRPVYTVSKTTTGLTGYSSASVVTGTKAHVHHPLLALYDEAGTLLNSSTLATQATERATRVLDAITNSEGNLHETYLGVHYFTPNNDLTAISWYQGERGIYTEVLLRARDWDEYSSPGELRGVRPEHEYPGPPDLGRPHSTVLRWAVVELTEDLDANSVAVANVQYGSRSAGSITWADTGLPHQIEVYEIAGGMASSGDVGLVLWHEQTQAWVTVAFQGSSSIWLVRFELTATLSLGGSAAAQVLSCSGPLPAGTAITVEDFHGGGVRNSLTHHGSFRGVSGDRGTAFKYPSDTGCNFGIIYMEHQAVFVTGTIVSPTWTSSTNSITLTDWWQGREPSGGGTVSVVDRIGIYNRLTTGDEVVACYDEIDDIYVIIDGPNRGAYEDCVVTTGTGNAAVDPFTRLTVEKAASLQIYQGDDAQTAHINLRSGSVEGMLLNTGIAGTAYGVRGYPQWTDCVQIRSMIDMGAYPPTSPVRTQPPWIRWYNVNALGTHAIASAADDAEEHKWLLPDLTETSYDATYGDNTGIGVGTHLTIKDVTGGGIGGSPCIQWGYTEPGWSFTSGTPLVDKNDKIYIFKHGILVYTDNTSFSAESAAESVTCSYPSCTTDDYCS